MRLAAVLLAAALCTPAAAAALDVATLFERLAKRTPARTAFVERKYLSILTAPLESSGTLSYVAPDRLEKHTLAPRAESLVLEGSRLTLEGGEPKRRRTLRLDEYPALGVFVESIRSTLAGDLSLLGQLFDLSLQGDERKWRLTLTPRDVRMQELVRQIRIGGSHSRVGSIEFLEPGGDRSVMTITRDAG